MTKIVHVVAYYPPHLGGMENVTRSIVEELAKNKVDVTVLTSTIGAKDQPRYSHSKHLTTRRLKSIEVAHTPIMWTLPFWLLKMPKDSIFHVHIAQAIAPEITWLIARLKRLPVIGHFHLDVQPSGTLGWVFQLYKKSLFGIMLRHLDLVIVFSEVQKQLIIDKYRVKPNKIVIVPNAVGQQFFQTKTYRTPTKVLRMLYVGRLSSQKRVDRLIKVMSKLTIPATLSILGSGELERDLQDQTQQLGLTNVTFEGVKTNSELIDAYAQADVFLSASDIEGAPLVLLEAMAMGLPIIATDVIGTHELIHGNGVLIKRPYISGFVDTLSSLWRERERLGVLSRQSHARGQQFSQAKLVNQLLNTYQKVHD